MVWQSAGNDRSIYMLPVDMSNRSWFWWSIYVPNLLFISPSTPTCSTFTCTCNTTIVEIFSLGPSATIPGYIWNNVISTTIYAWRTMSTIMIWGTELAGCSTTMWTPRFTAKYSLSWIGKHQQLYVPDLKCLMFDQMLTFKKTCWPETYRSFSDKICLPIWHIWIHYRQGCTRFAMLWQCLRTPNSNMGVQRPILHHVVYSIPWVICISDISKLLYMISIGMQSRYCS